MDRRRFLLRAGAVVGTSAISSALAALLVHQAEAKDRRATHNEYPGKHWTLADQPEDRGWSSEVAAGMVREGFR